MGFFKDFKEDVSQAVNELVDEAAGAGVNGEKIDDDVMVDTLDEPKTVTAAKARTTKAQPKEEERYETETQAHTLQQPVQEEAEAQQPLEAEEKQAPLAQHPASEGTGETAIITPGLKIMGDIESSGAIELLGTVVGNVSCLGKLSVSGVIKGNTHSSAFFSNKAEITGNISCDGAAKIGNGSVVIGDLAATSAVIAGAIKGDIDVHGPVIIDTTAIVMGDIKSVSVQINNGAVIEGHCSQCYSDNSPSKFFKDR